MYAKAHGEPTAAGTNTRTLYAAIHDGFVALGKPKNSTLVSQLFGCQLSDLHDWPQTCRATVANWIVAFLGTSSGKGQFT